MIRLDQSGFLKSRKRDRLLPAISVAALSAIMILYAAACLEAQAPEPPDEIANKVLLIEIDEKTLARLGAFPFDRSYHALLLKALSEHGARAVLFNMIFSPAEDRDAELIEAMRHADVYLPFIFDLDTDRQSAMPYALRIKERSIEMITTMAKGEGHMNFIFDAEKKEIRVPPYIRYGDFLYPHVAFLAACDYLGIPQRDIRMLPGGYILLGNDCRIPLDESSNLIIGNTDEEDLGYERYSYADVVESYMASASGQEAALDLEAFKGKICMVGLTAGVAADLRVSREVFDAVVRRYRAGSSGDSRN